MTELTTLPGAALKKIQTLMLNQSHQFKSAMHTFWSQSNQPFFYLFVLSSLVWLVNGYVLDHPLYQYGVQDTLFQSNQAYLIELEQESSTFFLSLSGVNALIETIQSSSVGFDFVINTQINIGHQLNTLSQLTELGVKASGMAVLSANALHFAMVLGQKIATSVLPILLLSLMAFSFSAWCGIFVLRRVFFYLMKVSLLIWVLCHLVLPYTIHLSSVVSQTLAQSYLQDSKDYFQSIHHEYGQTQPPQSTDKQAHHLAKKMEKLLVKVEHKISNLLRHVVRYFTIMLITCVLLPVLVAWLLYRLSFLFIEKSILHPGQFKFGE